MQFVQRAQSIDTHDGAFQLSVSCAEINRFSIGNVTEGNLRMRKDKTHHQIGYIPSFGGRFF